MAKIIPFPEEPLPENIAPFPRGDLDLLQNIGIHVDYIDALGHGKTFGAEVVDFNNPKSGG